MTIIVVVAGVILAVFYCNIFFIDVDTGDIAFTVVVTKALGCWCVVALCVLLVVLLVVVVMA